MLPSFGIRARVKRALGLGGRTHLQVGEVAPDIEVADETGKLWSLADLRGQKAVLFFYPADDTPGCTREACDFRDQGAQLGGVVLGISTNAAASHVAFAQKFNLGFPLLADVGGNMSQRWGVLDGSVSRRSTFVIDREGRIAHVVDPVRVEGHVAEVRKAMEDLP
jgi:thioredoxin-dependent peroxiredoxin